MGGSFALFLAICVLFGVAGGLKGRAKGSSFLLWFLISAGVPLFGFLAAVAYPGRQHELRRRCDGCGAMLPISDSMCMRCGTDQAFPREAFLPPGVRMAPRPPEPSDPAGTAGGR